MAAQEENSNAFWFFLAFAIILFILALFYRPSSRLLVGTPMRQLGVVETPREKKTVVVVEESWEIVKDRNGRVVGVRSAKRLE